MRLWFLYTFVVNIGSPATGKLISLYQVIWTQCFASLANLLEQNYPSEARGYLTAHKIPMFWSKIPCFGQNSPCFGQKIPVIWSKKSPYFGQKIPVFWSKIPVFWSKKSPRFGQKNPLVLQNPKIRHRIYNILQPGSYPEADASIPHPPTLFSHPISLTPILILSSYLYPFHSSGLFCLGCLT